ncbi:MAG: glycosyltransferase family 2 protein [Methanomicrobiales archaeon]
MYTQKSIQAVIDNLPLVSIIIVNWNGKHFLDECLSSLNELNYPKEKYEVIIVDNASTDNSVQFIKTYFPSVKIQVNKENEGFCKPNNDGVTISKGEYIVFLNNDTVVTQDWLIELVKGVLSDYDIMCCASKILYYDNKSIIQAAGGKFTAIGGGFYCGYGESDLMKYNKKYYTGFGCGAGVLTRKDFFEQIGGFDESYFASIEEIELGLKAWIFGYKVLYVPTAIMYHKESGTFGTKGSYSSKKVYLLTRNRLMNMVKNFERQTLIKGLIISLCFDLRRSLIYLKDHNIQSIISQFKGYLDFLKCVPACLEKRRFTQSNRKISDKMLYQLGVFASIKESVAEEKRLNILLNEAFYLK